MPNRKNYVVLGGAGFLGSNLCERLIRDYNVVCIDDFTTSSEKNINHLLKLPNFELIKHNINEPIDLEQINELGQFQIPVFGIEGVFNLAIPSSVKNFDKLTEHIIKTNTLGLINGLELATKYKAKFMHFSSSVIYGDVPKDEFIKEDYRGLSDHLNETACYDEGKRYAETIVESYRKFKNLDTKIVRIFRSYGPRMLLDDGQMIPDFILAALENKDLVIYGDETFTTSLCYVSDIVEGCIKVMNSPLSDPVNIGSTNVYRISDVAAKIIELVGSDSKIVYEKPKQFMRQLALPDITKIKEEIGWFPIVTLEDGIRKTVDFTRAHKDLLTFSADI